MMLQSVHARQHDKRRLVVEWYGPLSAAQLDDEHLRGKHLLAAI